MSLITINSSATRAAQELQNTLHEIASVAEELCEGSDVPAPDPEPTTAEAEQSIVETQPPTVKDAAPVPTVEFIIAAVALPPEKTAASVHAPVAPSLPEVPDIRPELAAFTAAFARQQGEVLKTLRQTISLCEQYEDEFKSVRTKLDNLAGWIKCMRAL